nr:hypothetical protein [Aeromicrobium sp. REDSEA-S38_B2]
MSAPRGSSRQSMFGANVTVERSAETKPAAPTPMPATGAVARSRRRSTRSATSAAILPPAGVGSETLSRIVPSASTSPAATLVPPMSTPTPRVGGRSVLR